MATRLTSLRALSLLLCLGAAASGNALAQSYPSKPIRIVVPSAPSTPPDLVSRIIAAELQQSEGWTVIVENKAGAVQTLAGRDVAQSAPDGYSIFAPSMVSAASRALMQNSPLDMQRDFAPIIKATVSYNVLVVSPRVEAKSMAELVALAQKNPGKLNYSSGGFGTPAHLVGELFKLDRKVDAVHVPYQQFPQAIQDLLSSVNDYMFVTTLPVTQLVATGKLRALAVTSPKRLDAFPGVATIGELGFPQLAIEDWVGFVMPKNTPEAIVSRMNVAMNRALQKPEVREQLTRIGAEVSGGTQAEFATFLASEIKRWDATVREANITLPN